MSTTDLKIISFKDYHYRPENIDDLRKIITNHKFTTNEKDAKYYRKLWLKWCDELEKNPDMGIAIYY